MESYLETIESETEIKRKVIIEFGEDDSSDYIHKICIAPEGDKLKVTCTSNYHVTEPEKKTFEVEIDPQKIVKALDFTLKLGVKVLDNWLRDIESKYMDEI